MRKINKLGSIEEFSRFVKQKKPINWDVIHEKENKEIYEKTIKFILENEQINICGYTEINLTNCKKHKIHIDHYIKKVFSNGKNQYHFDWNNLVVSIYDDNKEIGANHKDEIIKNIKEYDNFFNPTKDNCQAYFEYSIDGKIIPKQGLDEINLSKANKTIDVFNLNHKYLVDLRKDVLVCVKALLYYGGCACNKDELFKNYGFHSVIDSLID